jgi:hypothetical protein
MYQYILYPRNSLPVCEFTNRIFVNLLLTRRRLKTIASRNHSRLMKHLSTYINNNLIRFIWLQYDYTVMYKKYMMNLKEVLNGPAVSELGVRSWKLSNVRKDSSSGFGSPVSCTPYPREGRISYIFSGSPLNSGSLRANCWRAADVFTFPPSFARRKCGV